MKKKCKEEITDRIDRDRRKSVLKSRMTNTLLILRKCSNRDERGWEVCVEEEEERRKWVLFRPSVFWPLRARGWRYGQERRRKKKEKVDNLRS